MCYSKTEAQFELSFNKAMTILQERPARNENTEEQLQKFYNEKNMYASYILSKKKRYKGLSWI